MVEKEILRGLRKKKGEMDDEFVRRMQEAGWAITRSDLPAWKAEMAELKSSGAPEVYI